MTDRHTDSVLVETRARTVMTDYRQTPDPEDDPSYRAAVQTAKRDGIRLSAVHHARRWTVRAHHRFVADGRVRPSAEATGPTAGFAAWHALFALQERDDHIRD